MALRRGIVCGASKFPMLQLRRQLSSLPKMMRASVLTKADPFHWKMEIENIRMPQPAKNEVLIKVHATGVCHTDLHVMKDEVKFPIPAVMGHECSGTIVQLGSDLEVNNAKRLSLDQKVACSFILPCGGCHFCVRGKEDICETFFELNRLKGCLYDGTTRLYRKDGTPVAMYSMGALAEYAVVPANAVFPMSDSVPFSEAAIIGCSVFTAYGAIRHAADVRPGETVAVIGTGGVGTNVLQMARAFGAHRIVAVDINDEKLKAMPQFGATHTINASKEDVVQRLKEITGGRGVDCAIEALGRKQTFETAVQAVADGGRAVMVGIAPSGVLGEVEITRIVRRQIKVIGSYGAKARQDMPELLKLIEKGLIDIKTPVTQRYSLNAADQAYRDLNDGKIIGRAIIEIDT